MYINKFIRINLLKFCVYSYLDIGNFYQKQLLIDCFFVRYTSVLDRMTSSVRYKAEVDQYILKFWQFSYIFVRSNWKWKNINEVKARWVGPIKERQNLLECVKMIAMLCQAGHCWILHLNEFKVVLMKAGEHGWDWTINLPSLHAFNGMVGRIPYFLLSIFSHWY